MVKKKLFKGIEFRLWIQLFSFAGAFILDFLKNKRMYLHTPDISLILYTMSWFYVIYLVNP